MLIFSVTVSKKCFMTHKLCFFNDVIHVLLIGRPLKSENARYFSDKEEQMSQESDFLRLYSLRKKKKATVLYEMYILLTLNHFHTSVRRNRVGAPTLVHLQ